MALAPGTILGQYEIRSPLGAGGMGEVYRAHDTRLNRDVAIKVLPQSLTSHPERLRRFEQEAQAAAALNHPNILAVYQMGTHEGVSYMVTELLEGETLSQRLRRGPVPIRKVIDYGVQIARGLAAPHEKGIVHRDLKPDNIFLTNDGRIKILDFGLAKQSQLDPGDIQSDATHGTAAGIVVGTMGYMSPEQIRGKRVDYRADIFAFGTLLYELITGIRTFEKETSPDTMAAILQDDPPPLSQVAPNTPPGLQSVVHRCLEKDPAQRFQSASDLAFALESLSHLTPATGAHVQPIEHGKRHRFVIVLVAILVLGALLEMYFWMRPEARPTVSNYVQLTHDGAPKTIVGTDGSRLFLTLATSDYMGLAEMSVTGGEPRRTSILPSNTMVPLALAPDGSSILVINGQGIPPKGPLWSVPVFGGSPRRLGDVEAQDATWSADGSKLAYTNGNNVYVAKADGTEAHKVVSMPKGLVFNPVFSPNGRHLRFNAQDTYDSPGLLWEVSTDGTGLHRLLPGWTRPPDEECCGRWTADGKYFVFRAHGQIWALASQGSLLVPKPKPVQLTSSPLPMPSFIPSKDGKKMFAIGQTSRGELMRYDAKSGMFMPFLGGISAEFAAFSKDGQWVAYVSYPEGVLWRSRLDGSERMQLTYPPNYAMLPRWSPDGKSLVYFAMLVDKPSRIYQVSVDGGTPKPLTPEDSHVRQDPNWSPDGSKIVFSGVPSDTSSQIYILDLKTKKTETLPGSQAMFSPRWSPDGKSIVALSADSTHLVLFDLATQKWRELATGTLGWLNWSHDGEYLYVLDQRGAGTVLRVRVSDGKIETVVDLKKFATAGRYNGSLSLAPDDSPLLLRNAGTQDVYSLDWREP